MPYTKDQQTAIDARGRNILVAAAAGSGKTRVLVERIIRQLIKGELDVDELLVVTFTNAAAAEMRERIEAALEKELAAVTDKKIAARLERQMVLLTGADICTFHSFCQRLIRQHIEAVDVDPKFRLASEQELILLKNDTLEALLEEKYERPLEAEKLPAWEKFVSFMDDYGDEKGDEEVRQAIFKLYSFSQSQPFPTSWLKGQQDRCGETLADSPWLSAAVPEMRAGLLAVIRPYEETAGLVKNGAEPELIAAWAPYAELVQQDLAGLDRIREAFNVLELSPSGEKWDELTRQVAKFSWQAMRGKIYSDLKNLYPDIREQFNERRDAVKKALKKFADSFLGQDAAQIEADIADNQQAAAIYVQLVLDFGEALQSAKKERNILDFNDLEHFALEILCDYDEHGQVVPSSAALDLREKYKSIMVDEYQDTNGVQEAILNLIAQDNNRFTVGDVKQSIYRFRLADPYLFQAKYDSFPENPEAEDKNQLITMKQNFRSRAEVLAPINFIFDQIMTREAAEIEYDSRSKLYPGADYPVHEHSFAGRDGALELDLILRGGQDEQIADKDEEEHEDLTGFKLEAAYIAKRIGMLMESGVMVYDKDSSSYRPLAYRDIAVLMRAVSGKAGILLEALRKSSVPAYADVDGGYFEAAEVRLILALLTVIDNVRQDIPLAAVLVSPIGGFSMEELAKIRLSSATGDLYDGLLASFSLNSNLPRELASRTADFQADLSRWRKFAVSHSVPELIWLLYRETGYYDYVGGLKGGLLRQANLRSLTDRAAEYERSNYRGLFRFLRFIENLKKRDTDLSVARTLGASENVVRIMSIHRSKGLEFPVVIVADMAKQFNMRDAMGTFLLHKELGIGVRIAKRSKIGRQIYKSLPWQAVAGKIRAESKAEEMRILYVAMTRAKEKLILTGVLPEDSAPKKAQGYCRYADREEAKLPDFAIAGSNSYLDWVAAALSRHSAGAPLRKLAGSNAHYALEQQLEPEAQICINIYQETEALDSSPQESSTDERLRAAMNLAPMPSSPEKERVEAMLDWHYPDRGLNNVPAKLTVTEIKRRFAASQVVDEELPVPRQLIVMNEAEELEAADTEVRAVTPLKPGEDETDWLRPRFMQEQDKKLSPMERGTIMHTVMQRLDFKGDISYQGIKKQAAAMEEKGLLPEGAARTVYIKGIQAFFASNIGQQVLSAPQVYRELPFSRMLKAQDFYPEVQEENELLFTQGVIDLLVETASGELILIDYKTDRQSDPERIRQRYQIQLDLYRSAVEAILGRRVDRSYLYLLQSGIFVAVDDEYSVN